MLVHFIAPKSNLDKEIDNFRNIIISIHKRGHVLARDWLEPAYLKARDSHRGGIIDWSAECRANTEVIPKADIIVAEVSTKSFGVGYQVGLAVSQKKPVLLLRRSGSSSEAFLGGLEHPCVQREEYKSNNLDEVVGKFLRENDIPTKDMRFNFFIDRQIYNYLKWASLRTGKTKAEIIRELVLREIDKRE